MAAQQQPQGSVDAAFQRLTRPLDPTEEKVANDRAGKLSHLGVKGAAQMAKVAANLTNAEMSARIQERIIRKVDGKDVSRSLLEQPNLGTIKVVDQLYRPALDEDSFALVKAAFTENWNDLSDSSEQQALYEAALKPVAEKLRAWIRDRTKKGKNTMRNGVNKRLRNIVKGLSQDQYEPALEKFYSTFEPTESIILNSYKGRCVIDSALHKDAHVSAVMDLLSCNQQRATAIYETAAAEEADRLATLEKDAEDLQASNEQLKQEREQVLANLAAYEEELLTLKAQNAALLQVIQNFRQPAIPHPPGDPQGDRLLDSLRP